MIEQDGYIFTMDCCNPNNSGGPRCTKIVGYHYFDHHQPPSVVQLGYFRAGGFDIWGSGRAV